VKWPNVSGRPVSGPAVDEYGRESPRILQMETAPAQLQPELEVLVQQMNEVALIDLAAVVRTRQRRALRQG
jgi:hypothetical protein